MALPAAGGSFPLPLAASLAEPKATIACYAAADPTALGPLPDAWNRVPSDTWTLNLTCQVLWHDPNTGVYWLATGAKVRVQGNITAAEGLRSTIDQTVPTGADGIGLITVLQAATNDIWVTASSQDAVSEKRFWPLKTGIFGLKTWFVQLILDASVAGLSPPARLTDDERPVTMALLGSFVITPQRSVAWLGGESVPLGAVDGTRAYSLGFRELVTGRVNDYASLGRPGVALFQGTPGRFFAVRAAPATAATAPIWHYRDDGAQYYLRTLADDRWVGFTDGHPLAPRFRSGAAEDLDQLYSVAEQSITDGSRQLFNGNKPFATPNAQPDSVVAQGSLTEQGVSFDRRSPYGIYHWELFLHAPLLVADHLGRQQRFADADRWLRLLFDPTGEDARSASGSDPGRFWRFQPVVDGAVGGALPGLSIGGTAVPLGGPIDVGRLRRVSSDASVVVPTAATAAAASWTITVPTALAARLADLVIVATFKVAAPQ